MSFVRVFICDRCKRRTDNGRPAQRIAITDRPESEPVSPPRTHDLCMPCVEALSLFWHATSYPTEAKAS